jgi:hypothetical protein
VVDFKNGDPIKAFELEAWVEDLYSSLRATVKNLIPLGTSVAFTLSGLKSFIYRPSISEPIISYDSRSTGNTSQPVKPTNFLGVPWSVSLAESLNLIPSVSSNIQFTGNTSTYVKEDVLPHNPLTDLKFNGNPFLGNSPFLSNGYLGFSNFCQDTNIRLYPSESGSILTVKARRVSALNRASSSTTFNISNDSLSGYSNRFNPEWYHLNNLNTTVSSTLNLNTSSGVSGFYPNFSTSSGYCKDYGVWLICNPYNSTSLIALTLWDANYPVINNIVCNLRTSGTYIVNESSISSNYPYIRCLGCVYLDSNGKFKTSNKTGWGEFISSSLNSSFEYTELFQQDSEVNNSVRNTTQADDRRIVPSYYYMEQDNPTLKNYISYNGVVRDIPDTGTSQVTLRFSGNINTPNSLTLNINSCELSNGTNSFWLSNLSSEFNFWSEIETDRNSTNNYVKNASSRTESTGWYFWLAANPLSILEQNALAKNPTSSTIQKNNLRMKLFMSSSSTWDSVGGLYKGTNLSGYDYRCRLGWVRNRPMTSGSLVFDNFIIRDGLTQMYMDTGFNHTGSTNRSVIPNYTLSTSSTSTPLNNIFNYIPTINSNTTNSTADFVGGTVRFTGSSTSSTFLNNVNVVLNSGASNSPILFNNSGYGRPVMLYKSDFTLPMFSSSSTKFTYIYTLTSQLTGSTYLNFNSWYVPPGSY